MSKLEVLLGMVYSVESILLIVLTRDILKLPILVWFLSVSVYAFHSLRPKFPNIGQIDGINIVKINNSQVKTSKNDIEVIVSLLEEEEVKTECDGLEEEAYQREFMDVLKKTLENDDQPSIIKTAFALKENGKKDLWEARSKKRRK